MEFMVFGYGTDFEAGDRIGVWFPDSSFVMRHPRRFQYLADPLFLAACLLYLANRFVLKPAFDLPFLANHFNDLLLVPCAIPVLLGVYRSLGLRAGDASPRLAEIVPVLLLWSALFEWAGPSLVSAAVGDWRDVAVYWVGGAAAWWFWRSRAEAGAAHEL